MISWPWQCFKSYKNQTCHQRNSEARNFIEPLREPRAHLARVVYLILTKRVWRNNRRAVSDGQTDEPITKSGFWSTKHLNFDVKKDMRGKSMTLNSNFSKWGSGGIRKIDFEILKNDFRNQNPKFDVKIMVLMRQIWNFYFGEHFSERNFEKFKNRNSKIW